ncbi:MAG TPA: murein biosynthesis integral membrane protein MurJ [Candidatus Binataceae bacterium]|nr:murein biosynthesis integral membrane protein MurJ [Candidatus Binataceae bacterium]
MAESIKSQPDPAAGGAAQTAASRSIAGRAGAGMVASGILLSRIAGLVRATIFAHYLGDSAAADAFQAGFRIPNILQNLLGEGVLSASFIPVYSRMLGEGDDENGDLLAWSVGAILALATAILVVAGVALAPYLIAVIAPGFSGEKRELTVTIVRILFPGAGMLVMSAWCLGVLNSHHRFFASYAAPVAWNLAIIAALVWFGPRRTQDGLAIDVAWGSVAGAVLQVLVQIGQTLALLRRMRFDFARVSEPLRAVFRNLAPVVAGRGVGQMSAYVDNLLASLLPTGAVAALNYGQILYMLPVSLFGWSIAASELPTMARASGSAEEIGAVLRTRLNAGLRQISFLVVPSAVAFIALGDVICALIFQSGSFSHADAIYVWAVIAGSGIGMLAITMGRLYNSAFYALWDTRTPLKFAIVRVSLTLALGYVCALILPGALGIERRWGVAGLTASAGVSGWVEFALLRWRLNQRVGWTGLARGYLAKLWAMALCAAAIAIAIKLATAGFGPRPRGLIVLPAFGAIYLGIAWALGMPELDAMLAMLKRRLSSRQAAR